MRIPDNITESSSLDEQPMVIQPPKNVSWKDFGGTFAGASEAIQRIIDDAARRPRDD